MTNVSSATVDEVAKISSVAEAKNFIERFLATPRIFDDPLGNQYGFDLYIPSITEAAFRHSEPFGLTQIREGNKDEVGGLLMDAAWRLCLEGTLRPGARTPDSQVLDRALGCGFSRVARAEADLPKT
jgi:hypothetical protein